MNTRRSREAFEKVSDESFLSVGRMTDIQARRAVLLKKGLGPSEIAREEGVSRSSISRSIEAATTKVKRVIKSTEEDNEWWQLRRLGLT